MIVIKKKNVLHELAVCLFLTLEFNPDTTALSIIRRLQERSRDALETAKPYTGRFGEGDVQAFLASRQLRFTIDCGKDIVKGDIIRFTEQAQDNRVNPPRLLGMRGIIAEVLNVGTKRSNPMLHMRVISCGGAWDLEPNVEIFRTLRFVTRTDVMRAPWENESKRHQRDDKQDQTPHDIKSATAQLLTRRAKSKRK